MVPSIETTKIETPFWTAEAVSLSPQQWSSYRLSISTINFSGRGEPDLCDTCPWNGYLLCVIAQKSLGTSTISTSSVHSHLLTNAGTGGPKHVTGYQRSIWPHDGITRKMYDHVKLRNWSSHWMMSSPKFSTVRLKRLRANFWQAFHARSFSAKIS